MLLERRVHRVHELGFGPRTALHDYYYVTVGVGTAVNNARRFGEEIARELHAADVQGVILTAT